jgi:phosphoglycolate phosphatase
VTGQGAIRAVLLDLDGTLLDTAPEIAAAAADMLAELGLAPVAPAQVRDFIGKGIPNLVSRTLESSLGRKVDERRIGSGIESFFFHYEKRNGRLATSYPGVREGLAKLRDAGFGLACVTNKTARFTLPLLQTAGLSEFFSAVVSGDTAARKKPAPDPVLAACAQLGVAPAEAVMVGDSLNDSLAARAAGCGIFLVPYGYSEGVDVHSLDCDGIVPTLLHFAGLLLPQS